MKLSLCPQPLRKMTMEQGLRFIAELGVAAFELPVNNPDPWVDLDRLSANGTAALKNLVADTGLAISAVSIHREGQLLLGPHHGEADIIHPGPPEAKIAHAEKRLLQAAQLASDLEVGLVAGFLGCEDYARFFPWPDPDGWEKMIPVFQERVGRLLEQFASLGVRFAQEPHPKQMVYNIETALESVEVLGNNRWWGFNLDPANLLLAGVDPLLFVRELSDRIFHVHAKDGELVPHHGARSGLLARGPWDRPDRGFRFRIPGWGGLSWKQLISELQLIGYDGYLAVENEDPLFNPLDGLNKAVAYLRPLLPVGDREDQWW